MASVSRLIRGMGRLPYVGSHPGMPFLVLMIAIGAAAGAQRGGMLWAVIGGLFSLACLGPFVFLGAIDRARISDRLVREYGDETSD